MGTLKGSLEDREELRELYAHYAHAIDNGKFDEWINCFTEDGIFESPRFGKHQGREGLRRFTAIYKENLGGAKPFHQMTNLTFDLDGDQGKGCCYLTYYHCKNGKASLSAAGHYTDKLRKVNGEWKFQSRVVMIDGSHP
jgi:SnoaL-like domain